MGISRKKRSVSSLKELFFPEWSQLGKRRLRRLVRRGAVVELRDIDSDQTNNIFEINMLGFGTEYWLCKGTDDQPEFEHLNQNARLVIIRGGRLILIQGKPLHSRKPLQEHGLQAHKVLLKW